MPTSGSRARVARSLYGRRANPTVGTVLRPRAGGAYTVREGVGVLEGVRGRVLSDSQLLLATDDSGGRTRRDDPGGARIPAEAHSQRGHQSSPWPVASSSTVVVGSSEGPSAGAHGAAAAEVPPTTAPTAGIELRPSGAQGGSHVDGVPLLQKQLSSAKSSIAELVSEIQFLEGQLFARDVRLKTLFFLTAKGHRTYFECIRKLREYLSVDSRIDDRADRVLKDALAFQGETRERLSSVGLVGMLELDSDTAIHAAAEAAVEDAPNPTSQLIKELEAEQNARSEAERSVQEYQAEIATMRKELAGLTASEAAARATADELREQVVMLSSAADVVRKELTHTELTLKGELGRAEARIAQLSGTAHGEEARGEALLGVEPAGSPKNTERGGGLVSELRTRLAAEKKERAAAEARARAAEASVEAAHARAAAAERAARAAEKRLSAAKLKKRQVAASAATALREVQAQVQALSTAVAQSRNPSLLAAAASALASPSSDSRGPIEGTAVSESSSPRVSSHLASDGSDA